MPIKVKASWEVSRRAGWKRIWGQLSFPWKTLANLQPLLREIGRYPSAVVDLVIIVALIVISLCTVIVIPRSEVLALWPGDENPWYRKPIKVPPAWFNLFKKEDLPETVVLDDREGTASKRVTAVPDEMNEITILFPFDYPYCAFPQDLAVDIDTRYEEKKPLVNLASLTPEGKEIELGMSTMPSSQKYLLSQDERLQRRLHAQRPPHALFAGPAAETPVPLMGSYELRLNGFVFEKNADIDAEFVLYGQVHGLAGTDHRRRDLTLGLLWGILVAVAFGLLAAVGTYATTVTIAAVGTWFRGWVDGLIQRITEVNLSLTFIRSALWSTPCTPSAFG